MQSNEENPTAAPIAPSVTEETPPETTPEVTWKELGLSEAALETVEKAGYRIPSAIQVQSIPLALEGHDIIASSQTGSGKTASFTLPLVDKFAGKEGTFGLILAPTREIAQQIHETIKILGGPRGVRSCVLIGGIDMKLDKKALDEYPQIIVATPGRLCDHLDRGNIWLDFIQCVVLDEADRMLDMGFADQLSRILQDVPAERQTLIFSATFAPPVEALARKALRNPKRVSIGKVSSSVPTVEHKIIWMKEDRKDRELIRAIQAQEGKIIVFTRSKDGAARVWRTIHGRGYHEVTYISSDRMQSVREQALAGFKTGEFRILVATDVAGRGIHVDQVELVINYDLPMEAEDYVHRIGRTGRQGAKGKAISFATQRDREIVRRIEKIVGMKIPQDSLDAPAPGANSEAGREEGSRQSRGGRSEGRGEGRGRNERGSRSGRGEKSAPRENRGDRNPSLPPREARSESSPETIATQASDETASVNAPDSAEVRPVPAKRPTITARPNPAPAQNSAPRNDRGPQPTNRSRNDRPNRPARNPGPVRWDAGLVGVKSDEYYESLHGSFGDTPSTRKKTDHDDYSGRTHDGPPDETFDASDEPKSFESRDLDPAPRSGDDADRKRRRRRGGRGRRGGRANGDRQNSSGGDGQPSGGGDAPA